MVAVSVIVAVYNAGQYLPKCIDSLRAQSLRDIEIILIDDGSSDNSAALIDEYASRDKRIIALHNDRNRGVSYTRQRGLDTATGDYTIHVDPDDYVDADMLNCMYGTARGKSADVVMCDIADETADGQHYNRQQPTSLDPRQIIHDLLSRRLHGSCCNKLIARKIFTRGKIQFPVGHNSMEDLLVCLAVFNQSPSVAYIPKAFYHYNRQNQHSLTTVAAPPSVLCRDQQFLALATAPFADDPEMHRMVTQGFARHLFLRAFYSRTLTQREFRRNYRKFASLMLHNQFIGFPQNLIFAAACIGLYRLAIPLNDCYLWLWNMKKRYLRLRK